MNPETSPLLAQLLNAETVADQVASLRLLKHELIGYDQRKEAWVHWGIIPLLSKLLSTKTGGSKKAAVSGKQNGLANRHTESVNNRTEDEEACLQAAIIVGSLAQGNRNYNGTDAGLWLTHFSGLFRWPGFCLSHSVEFDRSFLAIHTRR